MLLSPVLLLILAQFSIHTHKFPNSRLLEQYFNVSYRVTRKYFCTAMTSIPSLQNMTNLILAIKHQTMKHWPLRAILQQSPPPQPCRPLSLLTRVAEVELILIVGAVGQLLVPELGVRVMVILHQHAKEDDDDHLQYNAGGGQFHPQVGHVLSHGLVLFSGLVLGSSEQETLTQWQWACVRAPLAHRSKWLFCVVPFRHTPP